MEKKIVIFGAGNNTIKLLQYKVRNDAKIVCICDNNHEKWDSTIAGYPIMPPHKVNFDCIDYVLVTPYGSTGIKKQLNDLNVSSGKIRYITINEIYFNEKLYNFLNKIFVLNKNNGKYQIKDSRIDSDVKKIKFIGWPDNATKFDLITDVLDRKYKWELSDSPDYIIASVFGNQLEFARYDCIRILFSGEPFFPDMNLYDYAIGFDRINLTGYRPDGTGKVDRYYRFPYAFYNTDIYTSVAKDLSIDDAKKILNAKKSFCSFLYSHESYLRKREKLFEAINEYKIVDSAGTFLNNMPDGKVVSRENNLFDKLNFIKDYKFTIASESISYNGFVTEKIIEAFYAHSIPIYYGDPEIVSEFNPKAFIRWDGSDEDLYRITDLVKRIDQDDKAYIKMLMEPKFIDPECGFKYKYGFHKFLYNIFDQDKEKAYRRPLAYSAKSYDDTLRRSSYNNGLIDD